MRRTLVTALAAAAYGAAAGAVAGPVAAARNLVKMPLLLLATGLVCAIAWYAFARVISDRMGFRDVMRFALGTFHDISVLLAALAPAVLFLALALPAAVAEDDLRGYPLYLGLNVVLIALAGTVALLRRAASLRSRHGLGSARAAAVTLVCLALALFVGGQAAWFLRPFYGFWFDDRAAFCEGLDPDFRGARSFYEAVVDAVSP